MENAPPLIVASYDSRRPTNWFEAAMVLNLFDDECERVDRKVWGGSKPGRAPNVDRGFEAGANRIFHDYFSSTRNLTWRCRICDTYPSPTRYNHHHATLIFQHLWLL